MKYWSGKFITQLKENEIFVFGSNPEGRHGAGAAAAAVKMGARFGESTGFSLNKKTYAIITKNLKENYTDKYGVTYPIAGERSISIEVIEDKINILYQTAIGNPEKDFLISYQFETYPNGTPKKSLNGYDSQEMLEMFAKDKDIPPNIVFHESYKPHLEKLYKNQNKQSNAENFPKEAEEKFTFFFETKDIYSQWHPSLFTYKDYDFTSAEQFMMFSKAKTFNDNLTAEKILNLEQNFIEKDGAFKTTDNQNCYELYLKFKNKELTPEEIVNNKSFLKSWKQIQDTIKQLGREVKNYDDKIWSEKRFNVVKVGNREKFNQNINFYNALLNTEGTSLVEASPYDKIWGIGLAANNPDAKDRKKWKGLNLLGEALTQLREYYLEKNIKNDKKLKM